MRRKPRSFEFVLWSTAKQQTVRALIDEYYERDYNEEGSLDVCLYLEPNNPVDKEAVAVVCKVADDYEQNRKILGGKSRWITSDDGEKQYVGQMIGYIARADKRKSALARDKFHPLPVSAKLVRSKVEPKFEFQIKPIWPKPVVPDDLPDDGVPF